MADSDTILVSQACHCNQYSLYYAYDITTTVRPTGKNSATPTPLAHTPIPFDAAAPGQQGAAGFGIDYWEAALRQLGEEGGADRAISGVLFHYPAHFFAFFEVTFFTT